MAVTTATKNSFTIKAYSGDNKTLLAFNFSDKKGAKNLAGFTIQCAPPGEAPYYLFNELQFQDPSQHAQVATEPANSSVNAPIHKFRWVHDPGSSQQGTNPATGSYKYTVTPRYFDDSASMRPLDASLSASVTLNVAPFTKKGASLGFTRGYMQSEAFLHHFGPKALIRPKDKELVFDTSQQAGTNAQGQKFTYADEYEWMGATARVAVFDLLNQTLGKSSLRLDMFAYDLDEPDLIEILLKLAKQGRVRIILDDSSEHHNKNGTKPEDEFTAQFQKAAKRGAAIIRGKFGRYAHDKVLIVSDKDGTNPANAIKVLTGSTNFSVTGFYVNANHTVIFDDPAVAKQYSAAFNESWNDKASESFSKSALAAKPFSIQSSKTPETTITFSPHTSQIAAGILDEISKRITQEASSANAKRSVIFAVMQLTGSKSDVYSTLKALHAKQKVFSYGISDSPGGVTLYAPGEPQGVLVTGKPGKTTLPPPFDQAPSPPGHEIHDKFVVCGFNGGDPVVYCGSSNLASGGEEANGDNADIATCFAIEGLLLVDHYNFLDRYAAPPAKRGKKAGKSTAPRIQKQPRSKRQAAISAGMYLSTDDSWTNPYFNPKDLHCMERELFG
jgi:hypothetical protein